MAPPPSATCAIEGVGTTVTVTDVQSDAPQEFSQRAKYSVVPSGDSMESGLPVPTATPLQESRYHRSVVPLPPRAESSTVPESSAHRLFLLTSIEAGGSAAGVTVMVTDAQAESPQDVLLRTK